MANKYALNAKAILLNNGTEQLLPVSKAKLIELANADKTKFTGYDVNNATSVEDALTYLLNKGNSDLEAAKTYTGTSINGLNSTITAENGYVFRSITEAAGKLTSYSQIWLDASVVSYQSNNENINTVKDVIENIQKDLSAAVGDGGSVSQQINTALDALDLTEVKKDGQAIVSVSQENGKVSAAAGNIDAQYVDVNNANDKFKTGSDKTTLTAQATLEQLQSEINAVVGDAAKYTIDKVTENLDANVAYRYQLSQSINGGAKEKVGEYIDIPKDSSLKEVYLGFKDDTVDETSGKVTQTSTGDAQSLNFVYHLENGKYSLTTIDVSKFLTESEFKDGLQVDSNGVVSVKRDDTSEAFLTVGAAGIKLSGVQSAINTAKEAAQTYTGTSIEALDSEIAAKTENDFSYVMTGVTETDGMLTAASYIGLSDVTVKTTTFDSTSELYKLLEGNVTDVTDIHTALNKIAGKVSAGAAAAVTEVVGDNDNTYINVTATKVNNTVTLTVNDSALGNVAKLHYDELQGEVESVTILGANPTV